MENLSDPGSSPDLPDHERCAKAIAALAEAVRQEAEGTRGQAKQKILQGVMAGLEIAAAVLRESPSEFAEGEKDAKKHLACYRPSRYAYLLEAERKPFRRADPNLHVSRVVKHKGKQKG